MTDDYDYVFIEIGHRDNIDDLRAVVLPAVAFKLAAKNPKTRIAIMVGGYDDDPRELWQIPEVRKYLQVFAQKAGIRDWRNPAVMQMHEESIGMLALADAFAPDHPFTVNYTGTEHC
jgi:hypothetical protein